MNGILLLVVVSVILCACHPQGSDSELLAVSDLRIMDCEVHRLLTSDIPPFHAGVAFEDCIAAIDARVDDLETIDGIRRDLRDSLVTVYGVLRNDLSREWGFGRVDRVMPPPPQAVQGGRPFSRVLCELGIPPELDPVGMAAGCYLVADSLLPLDENIAETEYALNLVRNCLVNDDRGDRLSYDLPDGGGINIDPARVPVDMDLETNLQIRLDSLVSLQGGSH